MNLPPYQVHLSNINSLPLADLSHTSIVYSVAPSYVAIQSFSFPDNDGPGKHAAGWQLWGKDNFNTLKSEFNEEFKASEKCEGLRATACNKFKKAHFAKLSQEDQEEWDLKASKAYKVAKSC